MKLAQIYEGWRNKLIPASDMKEKIEQVAHDRMSVCDLCEWNSTIRKLNSKWKTRRPDEHCTACGCTLSAKVRCLSCNCPKMKWDAVLSEEHDEELRKDIPHE